MESTRCGSGRGAGKGEAEALVLAALIAETAEELHRQLAARRAGGPGEGARCLLTAVRLADWLGRDAELLQVAVRASLVVTGVRRAGVG